MLNGSQGKIMSATAGVEICRHICESRPNQSWSFRRLFNQLYRLAKLPLRVFIFCTQSPRETELSKFACDLEDLLYRSLLTVA